MRGWNKLRGLRVHSNLAFGGMRLCPGMESALTCGYLRMVNKIGE